MLVMAAMLAATPTAVVHAGPPDAGARRAPKGSEARGEVAVLIARHGIMTRARLEGRVLTARDAGGAVVASREISEADRAQLLGAAHDALNDDSPQWSCPVDETFVSVTVDGRTSSSAVCPERNNWRAHPERWRAVIALMRRLLERGR